MKNLILFLLCAFTAQANSVADSILQKDFFNYDVGDTFVYQYWTETWPDNSPKVYDLYFIAITSKVLSATNIPKYTISIKRKSCKMNSGSFPNGPYQSCASFNYGIPSGYFPQGFLSPDSTVGLLGCRNRYAQPFPSYKCTDSAYRLKTGKIYFAYYESGFEHTTGASYEEGIGLISRGYGGVEDFYNEVLRYMKKANGARRGDSTYLIKLANSPFSKFETISNASIPIINYSENTIKFESEIPLISIKIYDALGNEIKSQTTQSNLYEVQKNDFTKGIYFYRLMEQDGIIHTGPLMIE